MQIKKDLKYATFEYDESSKSFTIINDNGDSVTLNKVYAFAFMRFVVRMAQRNWLRGKPIEKIIEKSDESEIKDNPDQMTFLEHEN
jgi:hypothetical protein